MTIVENALMQGDVYSADCPSREIFGHVTSKWGVLVLAALAERSLRWGELRRRIGGISEKMLAQTLRTLEDDGFVHREAHATIPPRVDYRLTPLGAEPPNGCCPSSSGSRATSGRSWRRGVRGEAGLTFL